MGGPATVKPAFQSAFPDSGDVTRFGPNAWNAARLFSGGVDGEVIVRDSLSATGASWAAGGGGGSSAWGAITGTLSAQTDLNTALGLKAPLASPALTGTPTAPTAAGGTNTTQVATTAFTRAEIAALVASAPATLDTLNELATALGNDPAFATTITTALGLKEATANKNAASGYAGLDGSSKLTGSQQVYGTIANTAAQGNDARLSDARTPTAHATSHKTGGSDAIKLDELAAPTDVVTLNVSTTAHGLTPKLSNVATEFLTGIGTWAVPAASISSPLTVAVVQGGTGTTSTLTLQPTSGVGTTGADIVVKNGTNGATEVLRIFHSGRVSLGTGVTPSSLLHLKYSSGLVDGMTFEDTVSGGVRTWKIGAGVGASSEFGFYDATAAAVRWQISSTGSWHTGTDNAIDLGNNTSSGRPRTGFFGTSITVGTNPAAAGGVRLANALFVTARNAANGADVNLIGLNASDHHRIDFATQTTIGANGAAAALTAQPVGYLILDISGTERIIPFYTK